MKQPLFSQLLPKLLLSFLEQKLLMGPCSLGPGTRIVSHRDPNTWDPNDMSQVLGLELLDPSAGT